MDLFEYLTEIRHAVETIIGEIHHEHELVETLQAELKRLTYATEEGYRQSEFLAMNPELDDDGLGTAIYWDTYFGADKERYHKTAEVDMAAQRLEAHKLSTAALAGSLLQFAKQGISLRYGKERIGCPDGRLIAEMPLHEVIWQGRNQAIHWEEGKFRRPVEICFQKLKEEIDTVFGEYTNRSMAYEVVSILGWRSFDNFADDLRRLE